MKTFFKSFLFALIALSASLSTAAEIYIVAGQSNGWRLSSIAGIPGEASASIRYFGMGCSSRPDKATLTVIEKLHPSTSGAGLAGALREQAGEDIVFIQYCVCGTSLGDVVNWFPGDDPAKGEVNDAGLYGSFTRYLADVRLQLEAEGIEWKVDGLFWHQGESDIKRESAEHQKNLENLFWRFRMDLGKELPIVAGHIRDLGEGSRGINRAIDAVAASDPNITVVNLDGLPFQSETDVHVRPDGCITLGKRMAEAMSVLLEAK
ncbi:MAG: sialate O-acetylesterase [Verrucomicrobiales bacterium]|nr:sialate O-acetylesterase [Verrucomicrobiales bacterium]